MLRGHTTLFFKQSLPVSLWSTEPIHRPSDCVYHQSMFILVFMYSIYLLFCTCMCMCMCMCMRLCNEHPSSTTHHTQPHHDCPRRSEHRSHLQGHPKEAFGLRCAFDRLSLLSRLIDQLAVVIVSKSQP
jgi:hypothetical protein